MYFHILVPDNILYTDEMQSFRNCSMWMMMVFLETYAKKNICLRYIRWSLCLIFTRDYKKEMGT